MSTKLKALIYNYFEITQTKRHFKCKTCNEILSAPTTSNLIKHLQSRSDHEQIYKEYEKEYNEEIIDKSSNGKKRKIDEIESNLSIRGQTTLDVVKLPKYGKDSLMQQKRTKSLLQMVIRCMLPISIIRNPSFISYVNELDPSFNMPNVYTITKSN